MVTNLPTELLRSFVAIVDSGSMLRATERVFVTQSALSLQMKRLEETVLTPLFHREGRRLVLTPAGQTLLPRAREILALNDRAVVALTGDALAGPARVGVVQDFAETLLSGVLARFTQLNPDTQLQVRVAGSPELLGLLEADRLDVVLCMGAADDPHAARVVPMVWHGESALAESDVLPIAILEAPCRFRDAALAALERDGRPFRVVVETPSLSALRAAVQAGLAVTCRTSLFLPDRAPLASNRLPPLPDVAYVQRTNDTPHASITKLAQLIHAAALDL
ncbi:LysR substrate-binding domain-containing protein [Caulobacter sp. RL271]|uniref:LysR substrate-binding domain-containing protein n=1 Tax=Caulobacter segnis TaxID=88688 RepID=A0ABY5A0L9_9CAUL|nr:LysR substrate-binding domain-containing protein [Caulobacter segnis]USQ98305.1 LysR substrate-binding domain-containing protein [Caulobacter segnis]